MDEKIARIKQLKEQIATLQAELKKACEEIESDLKAVTNGAPKTRKTYTRRAA